MPYLSDVIPRVAAVLLLATPYTTPVVAADTSKFLVGPYFYFIRELNELKFTHFKDLETFLERKKYLL